MKIVKTKEAAGQVLCHDMTQIIPGVSKDARFKKGHIVTEADIPLLLSMGKENLYVWENDEGKYHENEAAEILCECCMNEGMERSQVTEGKIELKAVVRGLFKIDNDLLSRINSMGEMMIASRHGNTPVEVGDKLCGMRVIPLVIEKDKIEQAREVCKEKKVFAILPYQKKRVGIVTTGTEVLEGRVKYAFGPVLVRKLKEYGGDLLRQVITDDSQEHIAEAIFSLIEEGAELVFVSGGMSVDPDDRTPLAIKNTGADIVSYGAPVLPGAMFLLSYYRRNGKTIPIAGLPGCVMYAKRTVFDLVLPRLMAEDPVTKEELEQLGRGGLCLSCEVCHYPNCGFGKGW